jgi:hypothetical protein
MVVLGIGADNRQDNYLYGLADAIRVAGRFCRRFRS